MAIGSRQLTSGCHTWQVAFRLLTSRFAQRSSHGRRLRKRGECSSFQSLTGKFLAVGGADNEVRIFDVDMQVQLCVFPQNFLVYAVQLSPDGTLAFCSGKKAVAYGVGAHWHAKPAFGVVKKLLVSSRLAF